MGRRPRQDIFAFPTDEVHARLLLATLAVELFEERTHADDKTWIKRDGFLRALRRAVGDPALTAVTARIGSVAPGFSNMTPEFVSRLEAAPLAELFARRWKVLRAFQLAYVIPDSYRPWQIFLRVTGHRATLADPDWAAALAELMADPHTLSTARHSASTFPATGTRPDDPRSVHLCDPRERATVVQHADELSEDVRQDAGAGTSTAPALDRHPPTPQGSGT